MKCDVERPCRQETVCRSPGREHPLGPWPAQAVRVLLELGLSEAEIARYFRTEEAIVQRVRRSLHRDKEPVSHV